MASNTLDIIPMSNINRHSGYSFKMSVNDGQTTSHFLSRSFASSSNDLGETLVESAGIEYDNLQDEQYLMNDSNLFGRFQDASMVLDMYSVAEDSGETYYYKLGTEIGWYR